MRKFTEREKHIATQIVFPVRRADLIEQYTLWVANRVIRLIRMSKHIWMVSGTYEEAK
jgi:hypothetical protein